MARRRHKIDIQPGNNQHFTAHLNPDAFLPGDGNSPVSAAFSVLCFVDNMLL